MSRFLSWSLTCVLLAAAGCDMQSPVASPSEAPSALAVDAPYPAEDVIPGQYIVVLHDSVSYPDSTARQSAIDVQGTVRFTYTSIFKGYAARIPDAAVQAMRSHPTVSAIYPDHRVRGASADWGIDRVDQRDLPLNGTYVLNRRTEAGSVIFVLDNGVRTTHSQFLDESGNSRASFGANFVPDTLKFCNGVSQNGKSGHGTHVAALAAGRTRGTAPGARVVSVRVLDCETNTDVSTVLAGLEWVRLNHSHYSGRAIVNLSLNPGTTSPLQIAATALIASNVVIVGSAGNYKGANACNWFPGSVTDVITVGATALGDSVYDISNVGPCVDLFAPGKGITSAWDTGDQATGVLSGTSQAAPLVAGAAALYLQDYPTASPAAVQSALTSAATVGHILGDLGGAQNRLLYALRPSPLSISVSGPLYITTKGTYSFAASFGGFLDPAPTPSWSEQFCGPTATCGWQNVALGGNPIGRVLIPNCDSGYAYYHIRATATDTDGLTASGTRRVGLCLQLMTAGGDDE